MRGLLRGRCEGNDTSNSTVGTDLVCGSEPQNLYTFCVSMREEAALNGPVWNDSIQQLCLEHSSCLVMFHYYLIAWWGCRSLFVHLCILEMLDCVFEELWLSREGDQHRSLPQIIKGNVPVYVTAGVTVIGKYKCRYKFSWKFYAIMLKRLSTILSHH